MNLSSLDLLLSLSLATAVITGLGMRLRPIGWINSLLLLAQLKLLNGSLHILRLHPLNPLDTQESTYIITFVSFDQVL